ncbi:flagellar basal body L-ring protein FlgH [Hyphococcus sp.]|jgi:flagellar L-ring protein precursor FlgH|uniref:flagellar basal body L-ring protein FlgH n=1 Tax=Hyphococcus sp. TaxID=2038636 RepID=UPI003D0E3B10
MRTFFFSLSASFLAALGGCASIDDAINGPHLSEVKNPQDQYEARVVRMPMPEGGDAQRYPNSLWEANKRSFFRDQRASDVGDILTVMIDIEDGARMSNSTSRNRDNAESAGLTALFGVESLLDDALPDEFDPQQAVDLSSNSSSKGGGEINRNEKISMRVAVVVTERLPNGNFVIAGSQEVQVNHELRELRVAGVIRPEDITADNTIDYFKVAEARIAYGGRGVISKVQQPRYGQRIYEFVAPF